MKTEKRILIAEDDQFLRDIYSINFREFRTVIVSSEHEALHKINNDQFDYVVTDYHMENKDSGLHVAAECIRHGIPFSILSGSCLSDIDPILHSTVINKGSEDSLGLIKNLIMEA